MKYAGAIPKSRFECAAHFFVNQTVRVSQGDSLPMKCTALDWLTMEKPYEVRDNYRMLV